MSWQKCPICNGTGIYPGPGTFNTIPACPTCKGSRIINDITGLPPVSQDVYIYSPTYIAPKEDPIEPAIWPNLSNSNSTQHVRDIPTERPQLQERGSERIDPVD